MREEERAAGWELDLRWGGEELEHPQLVVTPAHPLQLWLGWQLTALLSCRQPGSWGAREKGRLACRQAPAAKLDPLP